MREDRLHQAFWHKELKQSRNIRNKDQMRGSYLGPSFTDEEIENKLKFFKGKFRSFPLKI